MDDPQHAERIIQIIPAYAKARSAIRALALVGSHARGTARGDSDIDFVALATGPELFRGDAAWLDAIDWHVIGARPARLKGRFSVKIQDRAAADPPPDLPDGQIS